MGVNNEKQFIAKLMYSKDRGLFKEIFKEGHLLDTENGLLDNMLGNLRFFLVSI